MTKPSKPKLRAITRKALRDFATEIAPGLWQGAHPPSGRLLSDCGVDVLCGCAVERPIAARSYPGVPVVMGLALEDRPEGLTIAELRAAVRAGQMLARELASKRVVLVCCNMGLNRSGFVVAMALLCAFPSFSPQDAIDAIQQRREGALRNEAMVALLRKVVR